MYEKFNELLQTSGLTAYKVAKETGVSRSTLAAWKKGEYTPKIDKLKKIADYFGVPLATLTGEQSSSVQKGELSTKTNGYYVDKETAEYAEMLRTRPSARLLFSAAKDISKEDMQKAVEYIEFLKSKNK